MDEKRYSVYLISPNPDEGRPFFRAEWVIPGTTKKKQRSLKTSDEGTAETARADLEYELNHGTYHDPSKLTFAAFRELYFAEKLTGRREATVVINTTVFDRLASLTGPRLVADVDERMLSVHAAKLREGGLKAVTVKKHLAYLRAALRWAERQRMIPRCPRFESIKVPRKRNIRTASQTEFDTLIAGLPEGQWRLLARMAWHTGLRRTEMLTTYWERREDGLWIDFERKRIWIPAEFCKADCDDWLPLHPDLAKELLEVRQEKGKVFDQMSISPREVSRAFGEMSRAMGLNLTLHDLRRSFGTRYARVLPAQKLKRMMRHSSIQTTLDFYIDGDDGLSEDILKA